MHGGEWRSYDWWRPSGAQGVRETWGRPQAQPQDDRVPEAGDDTVVNEMLIFVSDPGKFDPVERLHWQESMMRRGTRGESSLSPAWQRNDRNVMVLTGEDHPRPTCSPRTIVTQVCARYSLVISIVFNPLSYICPRTGQCLFDRAALSCTRLIAALVGKDSSTYLTGVSLPAVPQLELTLILHQGGHTVMDLISVGCLVDAENLECVQADVVKHLKLAEQRAFDSSQAMRRERREETTSYPSGNLSSILRNLQERLALMNDPGSPVFAVISDFQDRTISANSAAMPAAREIIAASDAQLVIVHVGNEDLKDRNFVCLHLLAIASRGVVVDWSFMEQLGKSPGTVGQPEQVEAGYIGNAIVSSPPIWIRATAKVLSPAVALALAAAVVSFAVVHPDLDPPAASSLIQRLRRGVVMRTVNVFACESIASLPYPFDTTSSSPGSARAPGPRQEDLYRAMLLKWQTPVSPSDIVPFLEARVRTGWVILSRPWEINQLHRDGIVIAGLSWLTGRNTSSNSATLFYTIHRVATASSELVCEMKIFACGPRTLVNQYETQMKREDKSGQRERVRSRKDSLSKDARRLQEYCLGIQAADLLLAHILREATPSRDRMSTPIKGERIAEQATEEGCSAAWYCISHVEVRTSVVLDRDVARRLRDCNYGNQGRLLPDIFSGGRFDAGACIQAMMHRWPSTGHEHIGSKASSSINSPFYRRLSSGGVLVVQFFILKGPGDRYKLPVCLETRVSFIHVCAHERMELMKDLEKKLMQSFAAASTGRVSGGHRVGLLIGNQLQRQGQSLASYVSTRAEVISMLRDIIAHKTEEVAGEVGPSDTTDTDAMSDASGRRVPPITDIHLPIRHHPLATHPLSFHLTFRGWTWGLDSYGSGMIHDTTPSLAYQVFLVLVHIRLLDGYILLYGYQVGMENALAVAYKESTQSKGGIQIYACELVGSHLEVKVWLKHFDNNTPSRRPISEGRAATEALLERIYLKDSLVIHTHATFAMMLAMSEGSSQGLKRLQHARAKEKHHREHPHQLLDSSGGVAPWTCSTCHKRVAGAMLTSTTRWHCKECEESMHDFDLCDVCMTANEAPPPGGFLTDKHRFLSKPSVPSTVPVWKAKRVTHFFRPSEGQNTSRLSASDFPTDLKGESPSTPDTLPEECDRECQRLPQIDLLLRGGKYTLLTFPCFSSDEDEQATEALGALVAALSREEVEPLDCASKARAVLATESPLAAKANAILTAEPWKLRPHGFHDLTPASAGKLGQMLSALVEPRVKEDGLSPGSSLLTAQSAVSSGQSAQSTSPSAHATPSGAGSKPVKHDTPSASGSDAEDRWTRRNASSQIYLRLLNYIQLLSSAQVEINASDFPGGRYPPELIPPGAEALSSLPTLLCFVRSTTDILPTATGGLILIVVAPVETARPVDVSAVENQPVHSPLLPVKNGECYLAVVHEVAPEHLMWEVVGRSVARGVTPSPTDSPSEHEPLSPTSPGVWKEEAKKKLGAKRADPAAAKAFSRFLSAADNMTFAFGVYKMLQCGETVSISDLKRAQAVCSDYVTKVDITELAKIHGERSGKVVPHDLINAAFKHALDKNFAIVRGTECHYYFKGPRVAKPSTKQSRATVPHTSRKVSAPSSRAALGRSGRMAPSLTSSAAGHTSSAMRPSTATEKVGGQRLTASAVAQIPLAQGFPPRQGEYAVVEHADDVTSFASYLTSKGSSTSGEWQCESPRNESRLCDGHSYDDLPFAPSDLHGRGESICSDEGGDAPPPAEGQETGDDLPFFLVMTVTYQVIERQGGQSQEVQYILPIRHSRIIPSELTVPAKGRPDMLVKATLSLVASSIPHQFFELSPYGFLPKGREALRKCMVEALGLDASDKHEAFHPYHDAIARREEISEADDGWNPYQFFPHKARKVMERARRRVQAEVHKASLDYQLTCPSSRESPSDLVRRIELLRPGTWWKGKFRLLLVADTLRKPHLPFIFKEWLSDAPEIRLLAKQEDHRAQHGLFTIVTVAHPAEEVCVVAALTIVALHTNLADPYRPGSALATTSSGLAMWILLKLQGIKTVYRGPGGDDGLGQDRSLLKLRLWLYSPEHTTPAERAHLQQKIERVIRLVVLRMNQSLLLEDCFGLSPHKISDLLLPPDKEAKFYVAVKAAVALVAVSFVHAQARWQRPAPSTAPSTPSPAQPSQHPTPPTPGSVQKPLNLTSTRPSSVTRVPSSDAYTTSTIVPVQHPPQLGWLIPPDRAPVESWDRWGGLSCKATVLCELDLGEHVQEADVDQCLVHVWCNWQCDNRPRTYLWRGGKEDVYYFQFRITEADTPSECHFAAYHCVAMAAALAAEAMKEAVASPSAPPPPKAMPSTPPPERASELGNVSPPMPSILTPTRLDSNRKLQIRMLLYSIRPPPDEVTAPLTAEFRACMRAATVRALGRHLLKTGCRMSRSDLRDIQDRAERVQEFTAVLPPHLAKVKGSIVEYAKSHMRKWATEVEQLPSDVLRGRNTPPPHFIHPRMSAQTSSRGDGRSTYLPYLSCMNVSLLKGQGKASGEAAQEASTVNLLLGLDDWGKLAETRCHPLEQTPRQWQFDWDGVSQGSSSDDEADGAEEMGGKTSSGLQDTRLRILLWVCGDAKEIEPALSTIREMVQGCVTQVFCESTIETIILSEAMHLADFEAIKTLCSRAQAEDSRSRDPRRRVQDDRERWECCVYRAYEGLVLPPLAPCFAHDLQLLVRDLHAIVVSDMGRGRAGLLLPVVLASDVPCIINSSSSLRHGIKGSHSSGSLSQESVSESIEWGHVDIIPSSTPTPVSTTAVPIPVGGSNLLPVPRFVASTYNYYRSRVSGNPVEFLVVAKAGMELSSNWIHISKQQCPDDVGFLPEKEKRSHFPASSSTASLSAGSSPPTLHPTSPCPAEAIRYYDGPHDSARPCTVIIRVSSNCVELVSYNMRGEFGKGIQAAIRRMLHEMQKRVLLYFSILQQKLGVFLPHPSLHFSQLLSWDTQGASKGMWQLQERSSTEVEYPSLDDAPIYGYSREVLDLAEAEACGRAKFGRVGAGPTSRGNLSAMQAVIQRRQSAMTSIKGGASSPQPHPTAPLHTILLGVSGDMAMDQVSGGDSHCAVEVRTHLANFRALVQAEHQAAQRLRVRDAVRKDIADFKDAMRSIKVTGCPSYIVYPTAERTAGGKQGPVYSSAMAAGVGGVALLAVAALRLEGISPQMKRLSNTVLSCVSGCLTVATVSLCLPPPPTVGKAARTHRIITGPYHESSVVGQTHLCHAYTIPRTRLRMLVANCLRMKQSSRLYHCQRVPFLFSASRKEALPGTSAETGTAPQSASVPPSEVAKWKDLMGRLIRDYIEYLCIEISMKQLNGEVAWVVACANPDDLVPDAGPASSKANADDELIRMYLGQTAVISVNGVKTPLRPITFFAVAEVHGALLLIELSVKEGCFSLEFFFMDAAASASRRGLTSSLATHSGGSSPKPSTRGCKELLARLRNSLHVNSVYYDLQLRYLHRALLIMANEDHGSASPFFSSSTPLARDPIDIDFLPPGIDWVELTRDTLVLHPRPPLYSVNMMCKHEVQVEVPEEILAAEVSEPEVVGDGAPPSLSLDDRKRMMGRFFAYVCRHAATVRAGGSVGLLISSTRNDWNLRSEDVPNYECDAIAVYNMDRVEPHNELPIDLYMLFCASDPPRCVQKRVCTYDTPMVEAASEYLCKEVKRQCEDAMRNYRIHRLWKKLKQMKITTFEVSALLADSVEDPESCAIYKTRLIPMDQQSLGCLEEMDSETWARLCSAMASRCDRHGKLVALSTPPRPGGPLDLPSHWIFLPQKPKGEPPGWAGRPGAQPPAIIVEFVQGTGKAQTAVEKAKPRVIVWWCLPKAAPVLPGVQHAPIPVLNTHEREFFTSWVHGVIEALWATQCGGPFASIG